MDTNPEKPRRRWQFSLGGLLLFVTVIAIYTAAYRSSPKWGGEAIGRSVAAIAFIFAGVLLRSRASRRLQPGRPKAVMGFLIGYLLLFGCLHVILAIGSLAMCVIAPQSSTHLSN
jgi:uncharacterized BrkB/YihY/UPF0761 family membrane protein